MKDRQCKTALHQEKMTDEPKKTSPTQQQFLPKNKPEKTIVKKNEHGFYNPITKKIDLSQK